MTPRDAAKAGAVASTLRSEILAGAYDDDGRLPSRTELATRFTEQARGYKVSAESASAAVRLLAAEGWVSIEHGRGAFLRPRRLFEVWVTVPPPAITGAGLRDEWSLTQSVEVGARDEPAVERVQSVKIDEDGACVEVAVTATSPAMAGELAESLVWSAPGWSWEAWDLAAASVIARPSR